VETALRELVEELFEVRPVSKELQKDLEKHVKPSFTICNQGYTILQFSFKDLETMLERMSHFQVSSSLYEDLPKTVGDLVLKRKVSSRSEISHLVLLPFVSRSDNKGFLSSCMLSDVNLLMSLRSVDIPLL
jgi:hypothetical protein